MADQPLTLKQKITKFFAYLLLISAISATLAYFVARFTFIASAEYDLFSRVFSVLLFFAEVFIIFQGIGYVIEIVRVIVKYKEIKEAREEQFVLHTQPFVAVLVPSYFEPIEVLHQTIISCYNMSYKNKQLYLLDDSRYELPEYQAEKYHAYKEQLEALCAEYKINLFRRKWRGAKAGIINDFVDFIEGKPKEGSQCIYNILKDKRNKPKYMAVFDADQNPFVDFLEPLVAKMEAESDLAFIQTPQYYTNILKNRVARASGMQQVIFYEYICQGKGAKTAMVCCGTNVLYRIKAFVAIGGFDETSVTEDFATSVIFHYNGWRTAYDSRVGAFGRGPEDLTQYFKQQFRWSLGTLGLFRKLVIDFFKNPLALSWGNWWEYFISCSYYLYGGVYIILLLAPICFILFNIPTYLADAAVYGAIFIPYIIVTVLAFVWTIKKRGYGVKELFLGQYLICVTFPIYMKAGFFALIGKKSKFQVTQKGATHILSLRYLWPQLTMCFICLLGLVWGINRLIYEREPFTAIVLNNLWCLYNFIILSTTLYFNNARAR